MLTENRRFILNILAIAVLIYGIMLLPSVAISVLYEEIPVYTPLLLLSLICILSGGAAHRLLDNEATMVQPRICYMTTLFAWVLLILITTIPFYFGIPGYSVIDALFESTASWTTTGIGIYDIKTMPVALQVLRATCNWIGGIGIIMLTLSLLPTWQFVGHGLASSEFPGPDFLKSNTTFRKGYRRLIVLYISLTLLHFVLLVLAGMPPLESVLTALSNCSTSGLQHIDNGVATGLTMPVKIIVTFFAFLGSINCSFFLLIFSKSFKALINRTEIEFYFWRILLSSILIALFILYAGVGEDFVETFGNALMQVISFVSTSGYIISDCYRWPTICNVFILLQMFIGACAVSTGGGIKVARIIVALKTVSYSIYKHIHPSSIRTLTFNKKPMKGDQIIRANLFIALFMATYLLGALLLSFDDLSIYDALNYSQAMITNTGTSIGELQNPGLAAGFSDFSKISMCVIMLAGRLEIYPLLMIFVRSFWRPDTNR